MWTEDGVLEALAGWSATVRKLVATSSSQTLEKIDYMYLEAVLKDVKKRL